MVTKIKHISQLDNDSVSIDLDIDGVHVVVSAKSDVTVMVLNANIKVAEQLSYANGQSVRMNIRPTKRAPDAAKSAAEIE